MVAITKPSVFEVSATKKISGNKREIKRSSLDKIFPCGVFGNGTYSYGIK